MGGEGAAATDRSRYTAAANSKRDTFEKYASQWIEKSRLEAGAPRVAGVASLGFLQ